VECRVSGEDDAVAEVAEALAGLALEGIAFDDGSEHFDGAVNRGAWREEAVEPGTVVAGAEVEGVFVWSFADEADLAEVGAGAAIRATRDADADGIVTEAVLVEDGFEFFQSLGQNALTLSKSEAAGGQRHARKGVQTQAGAIVFLVEAVFGEDRLDAGLHLGRDSTDAEVLRRGEAEVAGVDLGDFAKGGFHRPTFFIDDAAAEDVEAVEPSAVGAFVPAKGILDRGEMNGPGGRERDAGAFLNLPFEPLDAAVLDGVFEPGVFAVCAVTEIALGGEDSFADFIDKVGRDETQGVSKARKGLGVSMAHAKAAADGDIVAEELAVLNDGDVAEVLGVDIDIVRGREDEACLEFAREVGVAIHRFALRLTAGDEFLIEVNLVIGASLWEGKFAPGFRLVVDELGGSAAFGIWWGHDIAVHIATGCDGIDESLVHALDELFDIALQDTVELEGLARGDAE